MRSSRRFGQTHSRLRSYAHDDGCRSVAKQQGIAHSQYVRAALRRPPARIARRPNMSGSLSAAALDCVVMAMCLDDLPWPDFALIAVIIAVAVLWKSVETFLEE